MAKIIEAILNWLSRIPTDKLLHDYAGELIAMFSFAIMFRFSCPIWVCFVGSNLLGAIALGIKELYDAHHKKEHSVELADFLWGLFGIAKLDLAMLIMWV